MVQKPNNETLFGKILHIVCQEQKYCTNYKTNPSYLLSHPLPALSVALVTGWAKGQVNIWIFRKTIVWESKNYQPCSVEFCRICFKDVPNLQSVVKKCLMSLFMYMQVRYSWRTWKILLAIKRLDWGNCEFVSGKVSFRISSDQPRLHWMPFGLVGRPCKLEFHLLNSNF